MAKPRYQPLPLKERLSLQRKQRKNNQVLTPIIKPSRSVEIKYRRDMSLIVKAMYDDIMSVVIPFLEANKTDFVKDTTVSLSLGNLMKGIKLKYRDISAMATKVATDAITGEAEDNSNKAQAGLEKVAGVSLQKIVHTEGLAGVIKSQIDANVDLIQSLPDEMYKSISNAIYQGVAQGDKVGSIVDQVQHITGVSLNRAKVIARDQIAKTNSLITEQRQVDLGIEEYVWQTAGDGDRVRATHRLTTARLLGGTLPQERQGILGMIYSAGV